MVCKWLVSTVGSYLGMGSTMQDYTLEQGSFHRSEQADIDVGEMFHNFMMHKSKKHALGVRCVHTNNRDRVTEETVFRRFSGLHFNGKGSPCYAYQGQTILLDLCKGDKRRVENPFHWAEVVLDLPPDIKYDRSLPRVMKLRNDGELARNEATYVDDIHVAGRVVGEINHN